MDFSPLVKQWFVASSPLLASLSVGGAVTYPTVLLHQLKKNDTEITLDFETASWIGAIHGIAGIPSIMMPTIMQWRGRKSALILAYIVSIVGWVLTFTATSSSALLVSECLHGFGSISIMAVSYLSISEMLAPKYRNAFIQIYLILQLVTMILNCLLTHYLHWKIISVVMCVPMILALIVACTWPESPYWLAYKGEIAKCQKAFHWLRGKDEVSNEELAELIAAQKDNAVDNKLIKNKNIKYYLNKLTRRDFYLPGIHIFILQYLAYGTGSIVVGIYSIELLQRATRNEDIAFYGGVIVNGTLLIGVSISMVLSRYLKRRKILLTGIVSTTIMLICASAATYLETTAVLPKDSLVSLFFILAYILSFSSSATPSALSIASELMPVKNKSLGGALYIAYSSVFHTVQLKIAPYLFLYIGLHGAFMVYAGNCIVCGLLIWKFVPNTQNKTLQQIEDYYNYGHFNRDIDIKAENCTENMLHKDNE